MVVEEEVYDAICRAHNDVAHCKARKTYMLLQQTIGNIPEEVVQMYVNHCLTCNRHSIMPKKALMIKPILSKDILARYMLTYIALDP